MKKTSLKGKIGRGTAVSCVCASVAFMCPHPASAEDAKESNDNAPAASDATDEEEETAANWVGLTVGGVAIDGNKSAFQQSAGHNGDFYGGIDSMRLEKELGELTLTVEGHALFGMKDYDVTALLNKEDLGYVKAGYTQFRTWYDGSGGFVPGVPGAWVPLYSDDDLGVDRGRIWFEAGLRMEDLPKITFGYSHEWREGTKDSTSWGQANLAPIAYGIVPTRNYIDERRDTFTLDIAHTLGNTDLGFGLVYENTSNEDTRLMHNLPGAVVHSDDRTNSQTDVYDSDLFGAHLSSETRFNDRMLLSFGYSYTTMDTDTTGSSRNVVDVDGVTGATLDHAFSSLSGGAQLSLNVANANFWWNPIDDLVIVPSFRAAWEDTSAISSFIEGVTNERDSNDSDLDQYTEEIEVRYTGLENLVLYTGAEFTQGDGSILYRDINDSIRRQTSDIDQQRYEIGANWYPLRTVSIATQYYHRDYDEDYDNTFVPDSTGAIAFDSLIDSHSSSTDDVNLRVTWRALPNLTLVSRYDYQQVNIENQGIDSTTLLPLPTVDSADITRQVFSQSATWLPIERAYLQGSVSYVIAETDTPANRYAPFRITDSENDYVTATLTGGYALDKKTDIQATYTFYYSNNYQIPYESPGVPGSVPFGSDIEEHMISVSLNRRITQNMIWNLGYCYYTSNDDASGGHNDFDAHMVSTGLQIRF